MVYSLPQITVKLLIFIFSTQLFIINSQRVNRINSGKRRQSIPVKIGEYPQVQGKSFIKKKVTLIMEEY